MTSPTVTYTYRIPRALKDAIRADAEKHSRSANQHVVDILQAYLSGELIAANKLASDPTIRPLLIAMAQTAIEMSGPKMKASGKSALERRSPLKRKS